MLAIGTLAKKTGTKVQTIRYYEQIGLMNTPGRTAGGQRRYEVDDLDRLAFIRHSRQLGFSLDAIREMLELADNPQYPCEEVNQIAARQLAEVENRIARLMSLKTELSRMVTQCQGGHVADCRVLKVLRDHSECLTEHGQGGQAGFNIHSLV